MINKQKVFEKMCKILPQDSFKNFIHKFILTSDDVLLFRRQFSVSYAINNLMNFIILDNTLLKNIVSIEIITLSSLLMLLSYKNSNNNVLLVLIIITISELNFAILFNINHKLNSV